MSRAEHGNKTMFAVIKTGGKQYKVAADNQITVMSLPGEAGERIVFDEVLALFDGATHRVGAPRVTGAPTPRSSRSRNAGARIRSASAATGRISRSSG
jgi:large subunit ribosomal protein L21